MIRAASALAAFLRPQQSIDHTFQHYQSALRFLREPLPIRAELFLSFFHGSLALICSRQTISDFLSAIIDGADQRRPYEFHGEPSEDEKIRPLGTTLFD